eukprot:COSAG05_NODE_2065_length_3619_cov_11.291824_3_plen_45_part_00
MKCSTGCQFVLLIDLVIRAFTMMAVMLKKEALNRLVRAWRCYNL